MKKETIKKIVVVTIFAIAMAFLEAVIVIYLRKLYYQGGFSFPLKNIDAYVLQIEWIREFFTIVMLASIGYLAAKRFSERFAYFLYSFAVWDIFYYIFLKLTLNWPDSIMTWDLLFLIPISWASPVIAPIICSLTMILFAIVIINLSDKNKNPKIILKEWIMLIIGSLFILYTFLFDYGKIIITNGLKNSILLTESYVPNSFNWFIFLIGELIILFAIFIFYKKNKK
jgi:hypothetical protein